MFLSETELCKEYSFSKSTVCRYRKEMEECGLYPDSIIGSGRGTRISEKAFRHYTQNRRLIHDPVGIKYVKAYTET